MPDTSLNGRRQEVKKDRPRLLIVEDHPETRLFLSMALEKYYRTDAAAGPVEAFKMAEETTYDGFLVDIALRSKQDGVDVLRRLRTLKSAYRHVPVLAVTAYALPGDRERFLEVGFDAYLPKPFFQNDLLDEVSRFFHGQNRSGHKRAV